MKYLLDTNIVIAVINNADRRVQLTLRDVRQHVSLSSIVVFELYFGAYHSPKAATNLRAVEQLGLPVLEFDEADARAAGEIRAALRRAGTPIGVYDVLIAGQAVARNLILVTNNTGEFARVAGLKLEDWTL